MPTINLTPQLDGTDKLRELVLYLCTVAEADDSFGSVKLNKCCSTVTFWPTHIGEYPSRDRSIRSSKMARPHA